MKRVMVLGAGGFIAGHLCRRLVAEGHIVVGADIKPLNEWHQKASDYSFPSVDLADPLECDEALLDSIDYDEIYVLAADMGGMGYIGGDNDAELMTNSARINLNVLDSLASNGGSGKVFYSSSACVYNDSLQTDPNNPGLRESDAFPADPGSGYGWEKLFSERLYDAYRRNVGTGIRIARFHNIYGPDGTYQGGREKAPAAICRKVAEAKDGADIEVWGDGLSTRSFLYIEDCLDGIAALMASDITEPRNIGSTEMVSINQLAEMVIEISGKKLGIRHIDGPTGVRGRNSNNDLMEKDTGWKPKVSLRQGMEATYKWIAEQVAK
jgi:GDP-D-mannose 3', 5'-epimerase